MSSVKITKGSAAKKTSAPSPESRTLTNFEKSVLLAFKEGKLACGNVKHAVSGTDKHECSDGKFRTRPQRRPLKQILNLMDPYKRAACACEYDACKSRWTAQHAGQYQQEYVIPGNFQKGVGKYDPTMPPRKVLPINFRLAPDEMKYLSTCFPDWLFIQSGNGGHDHPISHVTTMIATHELQKALASGEDDKSPRVYLDLHGNPLSNARMSGDRKVIKTCVNAESPKDYIRMRTKWGPERTSGKSNWFRSGIRDLPTHHTDLLSGVDELLSIHTLYYYEMKEVASVLRASKGKVLHAIMHRHPDRSGKINQGELEYSKNSGTGVQEVKQTNVKTGESYVHPCTEKWFTTNTWTPHKAGTVFESGDAAAEFEDSLTWTTNMVCEGTFRLTITCIPAKVATYDAVAAFDSMAVKEPVNSTAYIKKRGIAEIPVGDHVLVVEVKPQHLDFFSEMRMRMEFQTRDADTFRSHTNHCAVKAKGVRQSHEMTHEEYRDLAIGSFWIDHHLYNPGTNWLSTNLGIEHATTLVPRSSKNDVKLLRGVLQVAASVLSSPTNKAGMAKVLNTIQALV